MAFEIGIVCGQCDIVSPMGTRACPACRHELALVRPERRSARRIGSGPAIPAVADPSIPVASFGELARESEPPSPRGSRADDDANEKARAFLGNALRPRRSGSSPSLGNFSEPPPATRSPSLRGAAPRVAAAHTSLEELMEQAKNFVCRSCSTTVPLGHKFCGRCGAAVPPEILQARTQYFGVLQTPGRAKLILIRGEGEGLSYQLNAESHMVGNDGQLVLPEDRFISPRHANLFYRDGKLVVRDEGSHNGVYLRFQGGVELENGDHFLAGEELFRVEIGVKPSDGPGPDGTYFLSSPKYPSAFRIVQVLEGGAPGMTVCSRTGTLEIGREGCDLNFPSDLFLSTKHCKITEGIGKVTLTDLDSLNGTYVRIHSERELSHGDYLFIGRKLLRVEVA